MIGYELEEESEICKLGLQTLKLDSGKGNEMSVYKLAIPGGTAAADAVASLDIQFDGTLRLVDWAFEPDLDTADDAGRAEVSFLSVSSFGSNDARGSISSVVARLTLLTAESGMIAVNKAVGPLNIPVRAGERLYLHTGGVASRVDCYLHVDDRVNPDLRRRR